jgi:hypothetical protein
MAALRLQVEAWKPFDDVAARLVLSGEDGLAIAWDAAAARQQFVDAGLAPERCQVTPETLVQAPGPDGLRLLACSEGFEAQSWRDGAIRASRWWSEPLTAQDWQEFVHASGEGREATGPMPQPQTFSLSANAWARHYPLHATGEGAESTEQRLVFIGALALVLTTGLLAHQAWDAHRQGKVLSRQIAEIKTTTASVLGARDATISAVNEVEKLANWFALPLPVDVIGHLHETLGRSGVLVKDLDLEGEKLRLGLQLAPNATRAGIVRDLQAGGWFVDVAEVRADNARGLLTMEMRIAGVRPPVSGSAAPAAEAAPAPTQPVAAAPALAPAPAAPAPAAIAKAPAPVSPAPSPAPARPPQGPPKPIIAKPDANGLPPSDVFNAIPNR